MMNSWNVAGTAAKTIVKTPGAETKVIVTNFGPGDVKLRTADNSVTFDPVKPQESVTFVGQEILIDGKAANTGAAGIYEVVS